MPPPPAAGRVTPQPVDGHCVMTTDAWSRRLVVNAVMRSAALISAAAGAAALAGGGMARW